MTCHFALAAACGAMLACSASCALAGSDNQSTFGTYQSGQFSQHAPPSGQAAPRTGTSLPHFGYGRTPQEQSQQQRQWQEQQWQEPRNQQYWNQPWPDRNRHTQRDRDHDGIPDYADRDRDGDGVPNRFDRSPNNPYRH